MAVELEGLEFQIEAKSEEGTKGIDALTASLGMLKQATKGGLGLNSKVKELNKLNDALKGLHIEKLESLGKALDSLSKMGKAQISATIPKRISEIASSLHEIGWSDIEKLEDLSKALRDLQDVGNIRFPKVTVPAMGVAPATVQPKTSGMEQATSSVQKVSHAVEQVAKKTNMLKFILSGIGGVFSKLFSMGIGNLKELGSAILQIGKCALKAVSPINIFKKSAAGLATKVKQNTSGLGKLFSSMKRIAMYRAVRFMFSQLTQAMKDGINNLYQYSSLMGGTFANSMDRLASSGQYLKNSLGAMVAPIINALAPAIDFVIGKIVELLNLINMLFARLTGKSTTTVAKKVSASFAESAGQASSAAKELQKSILGFDELNVMTDNSKSGGGGSTPDYGSMFEEVPIDTTISDFANKLKQAFMDADWESLGTLFGGKVNEILNSVDWGMMGSKLGYGLNGAIQTAYYFLKTVDLNKFGSHIATTINSALENIDTSFIGKIIVRWFTSKFDFILGTLGSLDWGLIAQKISNCVKGAFDESIAWLNSYDWSQLGENLWTNIKNVVSGIDWNGIVNLMFTLLGDAIRSAVQFLGSFFGNIGTDIKNWWDNEISSQDWIETANNLLSAIGKGFENIKAWVSDNIINPFCNALMGSETWSSLKQAGRDMWLGFTEGIAVFFNNPGDWIKTNIVNPFVKCFKNLFRIHSPSLVMAEIGTFISSGLLQGILDGLGNITHWVKERIWEPIKSAFKSVKLGLGAKENDAINQIDNKVEVSISLIKNGWTDIATFVGTLVEVSVPLIKSGWTDIITFVGNKVIVAISLIKNGWTDISKFVGTHVDVGISLYKDGWSTISSFVGTHVTVGVSLRMQGRGLSSLLGTSYNLVENKNGGIITKNTWEAIPKYASGTANAHGSIFVAGEAGPEIMGHINGKTEILNKSQMAAIMYSSVIAGMSTFTPVWKSISQTVISCTDAIVNTLTNCNSMTFDASYHTPAIDYYVDLNRGYDNDTITDSIRDAILDASIRQNDLLREQNELLQQLLEKDNTVSITASGIVRAANRKNLRDGKTILSVGI